VRDEVLAGLAALGPGVTDPVTLLGQVHDLARFTDQIQGELARLTGALDAADGAAEAGYSSTAAFLRHACGRLPGRAAELVVTGRALRALPATGKALAAGDISFDSAHVICRTATEITDPDLARVAEEQMLALARAPEPAEPAPGPDGQTDPDGGQPDPDGQPASLGLGWAAPVLGPGQLRRLGEELIYRADPDGAEERERKRFERRHLSFGLTLDNAGTLTGACGDALSAEIIKTAVHAFGPPLGREDTRTAAQRRMDGLTAACQAALDSGTAGTRHGAAPHLSIMVDEQTLAHGSRTPGTPATGPSGTGTPGTACSCHRTPGAGSSGTACTCTTGTAAPSTSTIGGTGTTGTGTTAPGGTGRPAPAWPGPPPAQSGYGAMLTARQVLALACRADLSVIRWRDGIPLDVGRRYRTETPAIRRALEARDQGCRFTGNCSMPPAWTTAHHLKPWSQGGTTSLNDTALFCFVHHHYYIHLLGWTITGNPNGTLHFTHPNGWPTLHSTLPTQNKPGPP